MPLPPWSRRGPWSKYPSTATAFVASLLLLFLPAPCFSVSLFLRQKKRGGGEYSLCHASIPECHLETEASIFRVRLCRQEQECPPNEPATRGRADGGRHSPLVQCCRAHLQRRPGEAIDAERTSSATEPNGNRRRGGGGGEGRLTIAGEEVLRFLFFLRPRQTPHTSFFSFLFFSFCLQDDAPHQHSSCSIAVQFRHQRSAGQLCQQAHPGDRTGAPGARNPRPPATQQVLIFLPFFLSVGLSCCFRRQ